MRRNTHNRKTPVSILAASIAIALHMVPASALAQDAAQDPQAKTDDKVTELETVQVVSTYRASLEKALDIKRSEKGVVDAIVAQDIGKFPDLNLAESLQRIPGVVIARDAGEGRSITVRGLGPQFTRVRLNGLEAMSSVGSSDGQGGANRGRGFDFNVFASDLFSQLIVRKTAYADVEDGSLGATVDLRTARPFDFKGRTFSLGAQEMHNSLSKKYSPRVTALLSDRWKTPYGQFGALISAAYSKLTVQEEGYEAVELLSASNDGGFCAPAGYAPQNPANNAVKGIDAANCF